MRVFYQEYGLTGPKVIEWFEFYFLIKICKLYNDKKIEEN